MKSFPLYTQHDAMDCGPTCLRMVVAFYGRHFSLQYLRENCFISRQGVSMLGIRDMFQCLLIIYNGYVNNKLAYPIWLKIQKMIITLFLYIFISSNVSCENKQRDNNQVSSGLGSMQDSTILSVTYDQYYQEVLENPKKGKDLMRLDIGTYSSQYVSPILEWIKENKYIPAPGKKLPFPGYEGKGMRYEVFKNTPKRGYQYFIHSPGPIATRDITDSLFVWELLDGDSTVCEYPCKKARTTFRGRTWTVWYTLDLPYSDGPWKFCGLPGLILYAYESEGYFRFNCIGIEKGDGHEIKLKTKHSDVLDVYRHERAAELMMLEYWDAFAFDDAITPLPGKALYIREPSGKIYRPGEWPPQTAILYEKYPGINMKKKYPQKKKASKKK